MKTSKITSALASLILAFGSSAAISADIIIISVDPAGVGFNDPTAVDPVGGNPGTTLGEQRLNVFNVAAQKWGARLSSNVPIFVRAQFGPQFCTPTSAVLASAGPFHVFNDPSLPLADTWYVGALTDALVGFDAAPGFFDIGTTFNGDIGVNPNCLTGQSWYNGYDNNNDPTSEIDLLSVVMHELSHGLGFLELASEDTGGLFFGLPDAYLVNMADATTGESWADMTDAERLASQINSGNLVWTGPSVTADAPHVLGPRPSIQINNPKSLKGSYEVQAASYGPALRENGGTTGKMVVVNDGAGASTSDGCEPILNNISGKIAIIDRGVCTFTTKTANAQLAGAKGVVVVNNQPGGPASMGGADNPFFVIPSVGVTQALGAAFKAAASHNSVGKMILDGNIRAGTQDGYVRLYAPNPVAPGSSKSHFDVSATPNLLMEPFINDDLASAVFVDLTTNVFEDIGWPLQ